MESAPLGSALSEHKEGVHKASNGQVLPEGLRQAEQNAESRERLMNEIAAGNDTSGHAERHAFQVRLLKALAVTWLDHPDYNPTWAP